MSKIMRVLVALCMSLGIAGVGAQAFPSKPVRIIVPWPVGGGADYVARAFGAELAKVWGQPVVVDNIGGAGSIIGAERVTKAAPDGHTLMLTINGTIVGNRFLYKQLPYDSDRGFMPISLLVQSGQLILASADLKAKSLREIVDLARRESGKIAYASYGRGTQPHLLFEVLGKREKLSFLHVPYKGLAPALTAVMAGEVQLTVVSPSSADAAMKSGRVKPIAIGSDTRAKTLPDVPTVTESGFPFLRSSIWFGLFAPPGTPTALIERIHADISNVAKDAEFAKRLTDRGLDVVAAGPSQFAALIKDEVERTAEAVEAAGIVPE